MKITKVLIVFFALILIIGCGNVKKSVGSTTTPTGADTPAVETIQPTEKPSKKQDKCPDAIIDWADMLMTGGIKYSQNYDGSKKVTEDQTGDEIGMVTYMLDGNACSTHVMENGDAAFLPIGTKIYNLKGYKSEFRVVADHKIYEAHENPGAKTLGDLLDIQGKVEKVSIESSYDGSHVRDFDTVASVAFEKELLALKSVDFNQIYEKIKHEEGVFMRVHLRDGTSFRAVYYPVANAINPSAFGTDKLKKIIMSQVK
jgi:hypothetical protein